MPRGKGKAEEEKRVWAWKGSGWARVRTPAPSLAGPAGGNTDPTTEGAQAPGAYRALAVPGTKHSAPRLSPLISHKSIERRHYSILFIDGKLRQGKRKILAQGHPASR